jgi:hypothetical protein
MEREAMTRDIPNRWRTRIPPAPLDRQTLTKVWIDSGSQPPSRLPPYDSIVSVRIYVEDKMIGGGDWMLRKSGEQPIKMTMELSPGVVMYAHEHYFVQCSHNLFIWREILDPMTKRIDVRSFEVSAIDPLVGAMLDARDKSKSKNRRR